MLQQGTCSWGGAKGQQYFSSKSLIKYANPPLTALEGTFLNQYQSGLRHFLPEQKTVLGSLDNRDFFF